MKRIQTLTLPQNLRDISRNSTSVTRAARRAFYRRLAGELLAFAATVALIGMIFVGLYLLGDTAHKTPDTLPSMPLAAGSLATLLGGKPARRKAKKNFKIVGELKGDIPSRRHLQSEQEEHAWKKHFREMLQSEMKEVLS
ncbi:hypothetical protein FY034_17230 (plasmid) [Trichlorobacter lovleyi]|uniref:hypothetical protein n=1 Tax=Trichlorobacter lovleyi TaxID=313985 RepID=UPI00223F7D67|nr:hypothetical protein [Trichlorobacter lovleyi]QOX80766.1 hypothetical protein FY034_17230 [Trichlorobacter lovleyi]